MVIVEHLAKCGAMGRLKQCPILVTATIFNREAVTTCKRFFKIGPVDY